MAHNTIEDLCGHLIENEDWTPVWGLAQELPARGFEKSKYFKWYHHPPLLMTDLLKQNVEASYILKGALSPDASMIMWSSFMVGRAYLEEAVMDFLLFMRCNNLLRDSGSSLNVMETLILASIRPERFFEDVAKFFCDLQIPPMPMRPEIQLLWQALPRKSKLSKPWTT